MSKKKIILAFSGGLDTSFAALWLIKKGYEVITLTVDTGGFTESDRQKIAKQSKLIGCTKHYFLDGKKELYDKIASYIIKGNILRGGIYPLCAGPERLIIAGKLVEKAKSENTHFVSHGSTGAGNDQVRFDITVSALAPDLHTIAPIRELGITRDKEIEFLKKHGIKIPVVSKKYSVNKGMLGITVAGKETKSSWEIPPEDIYPGITPLSDAPNIPDRIIVSFTQGLPAAVNGKVMSGVEITQYLAKAGGIHAVGQNIHLGNTILGIKGRIAFAAPAMTILITAHRELEKLVFTKWQSFWKNTLSEVYGNFLHEALYFDPVMRDIEAMIDSSQNHVTGDVKVKLHKGNIIIEGCKSPYSLMSSKIAVYGEENALWTGIEAAGFSKIYGLQSSLAFNVQKNHEK